MPYAGAPQSQAPGLRFRFPRCFWDFQCHFLERGYMDPFGEDLSAKEVYTERPPFKTTS